MIKNRDAALLAIIGVILTFFGTFFFFTTPKQTTSSTSPKDTLFYLAVLADALEIQSISTNSTTQEKLKTLYSLDVNTYNDFFVSPNTEYVYIRTASPENELQNYLLSLREDTKIALDTAEGLSKYQNSDYKLSLQRWSHDSNYFVAVAQDQKSFTPETRDRCCEGGDYRESETFILTINIHDLSVQELHKTISPGLEVHFYDPEKNLLVYSSFNDGKLQTIDTKNNAESKSNISPIWNVKGDNAVFAAYGENNSVLLYSAYDLSQPLTEILPVSGTSGYTNHAIWSHDSSYVALQILGGNKSVIYDANGNKINEVKGYSDPYSTIFSQTGNSIITRGLTARSILGDQSDSMSFGNRGTPIIWFDE